MKSCRRHACDDSFVSGGFGARDKQVVAGRHNTLGNSGNLRRVLPGPENDFGEPLTDAAMVIDPGESQIFEGGLAQNLKDAGLRGLRRSGARADLVEERAQLVTVHRVRTDSKLLMLVDFAFC